MAEAAWDKYNASDVNIDVVEVKSLINALERKGKSHTGKQISTITKLSERLNKAKSDIKQQISRIDRLKESGDSKKGEIEILEDDLVLLHHELQKATDALRKACDVKLSELKFILEGEAEQDSNDSNDAAEHIDGNISDSSIIGDIKGADDVVADDFN